MKILFVVNRASGRKKDIDWETIIKDHFKGLGHRIEFLFMPVEEASEKLGRMIGEFRPQRVVAVGGDGTVSFVAKELMGRNIQMGIIPAGSANGMGKEVGIPEDPEKSLPVILEGEVKKVDVIGVNDKEICLHLSDLGLNAQLVKYFQQSNMRGKMGYAFALIRALYRKQRIRVIVQTRDMDIERSAIMVLIANASRYGTGLTINPEGSIYDGFFEVVIVRKIGISEIVKMLFRFQRFNPENIEVFSARSATLETTREVHFQVDGEYAGKVSRVEARVLPQKLELLVPQEA